MNKKWLGLFLCIAMLVPMWGCANQEDNKVVIYSSAEEYRNEFFQQELDKQFPNYDITIEYMTSGNQAAKLLAEGEGSACDITYDLEYGYVDKLRGVLADLSSYDMSQYVDDLVDNGKNVLPEARNGGCIAINRKMLEDKGLPIPESYQDLLKPEYKGLISMPNPKSSGTGYMFLKSLVNAWGEEEAFEYFKELTPNVLAYTSSGSGPVNALVQGEAAIGLAMTAQTVTEINNGADLEILFFEEGSPYSLYGTSMIKGKEQRACVKEVFDYLVNTLLPQDKEKFFPEKIYKDRDFSITNYPTDIQYADMSNNTAQEKERLLAKWEY
ncbi:MULTISPECIES: extracellular solute-binding protein [unclassified Clostridium]|uniref:extracellular solute-binding protein n=1 Tax=unclassified Clostridium TaxID=2614128 RepID=UPI001106CCE0|nr:MULTISPECIES: extracellular solute-binding protein [unclassified Clostridium]